MMKKMRHSKYFLVSIVFAALSISCETEFSNPNSVSEDLVYTTREGVIAAAVGLQQIYSTTGVRWIIETPAVTAREVGITTTFQNMIELEDGGSGLPNENANVEGLWFTMARVIKTAEQIEVNIDGVDLSAGTISGLTAHAKFFKALAIGTLAQNYENVILTSGSDGDATFVPRLEGFARAIELLSEASAALSTPPSQEFIDEITQGHYDLPSAINAISARYHLFAGNYAQAITAARSVDVSKKSEFTYTANATNPIWARANSTAPNFKARAQFGLPASLALDDADGRIAFYLDPNQDLGEVSNPNGYQVVALTGFFTTSSGPIPIYLPDEMHLIIAEASARSGNVSEAISALNQVLTDTDDLFGVNAGLPAYNGGTSQGDVLDEIYKNRRAELYLTGMSLEDSRRFNRPAPSGSSQIFTEERNRNFYPYPSSERQNNPNTPNDPPI